MLWTLPVPMGSRIEDLVLSTAERDGVTFERWEFVRMLKYYWAYGHWDFHEFYYNEALGIHESSLLSIIKSANAFECMIRCNDGSLIPE